MPSIPTPPNPLTALQKAHERYKELNKERANRLLELKGFPKYLGAFYAGFTASLGIATLFGSVIAMVLSAAAFISITITPIGWGLISAGFIAAVVGVGINEFYKFFSNIKALREDRQNYLRLDGDVFTLGEQIKRTYHFIDIAEERLKALGISDEKTIAQRTVTQATAVNTEAENLSNDQATNSTFIWRIFARLKNILYKATVLPVKYVASKLYLPQLVNYLALKFPQIAKFINDIHAIINPYVNKVLEFVGIYGTVVAALSGILTGAAEATGICLAKMGLVPALTAVLAALGIAVSGPVALGIILTVGGFIALSLFINKVFYNDPLALFRAELKADLSVLPTTIDHNRLLLAAAKAQLGECEAKIKVAELEQALAAEKSKNEGIVEKTPLAALEPAKEPLAARGSYFSSFNRSSLSFMWGWWGKQPDFVQPQSGLDRGSSFSPS